MKPEFTPIPKDQSQSTLTIEDLLDLVNHATKGATSATSKLIPHMPPVRPGEELVEYDDDEYPRK